MFINIAILSLSASFSNLITNPSILTRGGKNNKYYI